MDSLIVRLFDVGRANAYQIIRTGEHMGLWQRHYQFGRGSGKLELMIPKDGVSGLHVEA